MLMRRVFGRTAPRLQGGPRRRELLKARQLSVLSSAYSKVNDADLEVFRSVLDEKDVITDAETLVPFNTDWMGKYQGNTQLVLRPRTTEQVSEIFAHCNSRLLPVVPQGGNTGLVGGSVPIEDEIVVSLQGMSRILDFDEVGGSVTCEAGAVLQTLQEYVEERGFTMPLDLGAKGSCQIGGNVATNAGGLRYLRYGSLHGTVLGLEAVLADGTVVDSLNTLRKDNTGYDLKQLFIGSEGTLGVITKVALALPKSSPSVQLACLAVADWEGVLKVFQGATRHLSEILSAVEYYDDPALDMVLEHGHGMRNPLETRAPFYMLVETSGSNADHDFEKLNSFLEEMMGDGTVVDGTLAQDESQKAGLWKIREGITESLGHAGAVYKYDISLPLPKLNELVEVTRARLESKGATVVGFGHIGDGNVHLNISTPEYDEEVLRMIEPWVFEWTHKERGSISAEHGIGSMKAEYMHLSKTDPSIALMRALKTTMDPNSILNPNKVLPQQQAV